MKVRLNLVGSTDAFTAVRQPKMLASLEVNWLKLDFIFKFRLHDSPHITTRTYARIVEGWVESIGLDPSDYGTHSLRRTKASLLYKMRHNLREIQILLGHKKIESTVHYLGITVEDALESSEHLDL